ncbi:antitoxin Xre/MbcA/ParS toxin-binding domain-containing protein (plasmid) [Glycocaulis abyssi]|uniref:Antitoxin Xre/MbcA/ParS toxin-binding domain-containing protein n=1 Tax=Glycocaulis abyssi TaxID=1433403 RepID=A0ABV9NHJ9_9PROT
MALADEITRKTEFDLTVEYLGGEDVFDASNPVEAHRAIAEGLPLASFIAMLTHVPSREDVEFVTGLNKRAFQRLKSHSKRLSPDQSGNLWSFARILATATDVLGSREDALQWLKRPSMALDNERPIDLIRTPAGSQLLEAHLRRLEYGVYT